MNKKRKIEKAKKQTEKFINFRGLFKSYEKDRKIIILGFLGDFIKKKMKREKRGQQ